MLWRGADEFRVHREVRVYTVSVAPVIGWMMAFHSVYCVLCGTEGGVCFALVRVVILASGATTIVVAIACYGDWYNHWWETTLVISVALQRLWLWSVCGGASGGASGRLAGARLLGRDWCPHACIYIFV